MTMREKIESILGGFLDRNGNYAISGCIRNGISGSTISSFWFSIDKKTESNDKRFQVTGNIGDVNFDNSIFIQYEEVLACFEERDEYNQQSVYVILKNGILVEFECVGLRG